MDAVHSTSPSSQSSTSPSTLKESLEISSRKGELTRARSILQTWISTHSPPTPIALNSALDSAVSYGHVSIVRLLLEQGALITNSTTTFATLGDKPNSLAIFEIFLEYGWSVQSTASKNGPMAMCYIMSNPDGESLLKWFLDHGAPANGLPSDPGAPLRKAPTATMASYLLNRGAVVKYTSALHAAVARKDDADALPLMNLLLDNGIDINELQYEGRDKLPREAALSDHGTALHVAVGKDSVERAKVLVERGADLEKKSRYGWTARDWAQLREKENVKIYLENVMRQRGMEVREVDYEEDHEEDDYNLSRA